MNKLRDVYTIGREARNIDQEKKLTISKTMPFVIDRSKFEKRPSVSKVFALFTWGSWDLLDLPFVLNTDYLDLEFNTAKNQLDYCQKETKWSLSDNNTNINL